MTIDEIMTRAAQLLDEQIGVARAKEVDDLPGEPTDEYLRFRDEVWREWRAETLAFIREKIIHDFKTVH